MKRARLSRLRGAIDALIKDAERFSGVLAPGMERDGLTLDALRRMASELERIESDRRYARHVGRDNRWTRETAEAALLKAFRWHSTDTVTADEWAAVSHYVHG